MEQTEKNQIASRPISPLPEVKFARRGTGPKRMTRYTILVPEIEDEVKRTFELLLGGAGKMDSGTFAIELNMLLQQFGRLRRYRRRIAVYEMKHKATAT